MTTDEYWPVELDGVIAAPDHHRVLFENDRVRVIETVVKVGDTTPVHIHPRTVMYVVSGDQFVRRSVAVTDHTRSAVGDVVLLEVTTEPSQFEQVSEHSSHVEEWLGPNDPEPIDEAPLRDRLHIFTLGVARMIEARLRGLDLHLRRNVAEARRDRDNEHDTCRPQTSWSLL